MPASAGRVEASVEDAQTGVRSGFVSRVTNDGAPPGSQTQHVVMVGRRAGRLGSASVARGVALSLCSPSAGSSAESPRRVGAPRGAPLCQDEDLRGSSGPVGGWPPSPAACGPDSGEGDTWFAPGRSMAQCRVRLSWALFGRRRTSPACGPQGGGLQQSARRRATGTSGEPLG